MERCLYLINKNDTVICDYFIYIQCLRKEKRMMRCLPKQTISLVSIVPDSPIFTIFCTTMFFS